MRKGSEDPSLAWGAGTLNYRWHLRLPPVFVDAAHLGSVGRNITAATTLGMAQHHEEAASEVNNLQVVLICFPRAAQAASPLMFGLLIDWMGVGALAVSAGMSIAALLALIDAAGCPSTLWPVCPLRA